MTELEVELTRFIRQLRRDFHFLYAVPPNTTAALRHFCRDRAQEITDTLGDEDDIDW